MTNSELAILAVSKVTTVPKSIILSATRIWPAVEARQLVILLLSNDRAPDGAIALTLNRGRCSILKSRHNAVEHLRYSTLFRHKYNKCMELYEKRKSLRISENAVS